MLINMWAEAGKHVGQPVGKLSDRVNSICYQGLHPAI